MEYSSQFALLSAGWRGWPGSVLPPIDQEEWPPCPLRRKQTRRMPASNKLPFARRKAPETEDDGDVHGPVRE